MNNVWVDFWGNKYKTKEDAINAIEYNYTMNNIKEWEKGVKKWKYLLGMLSQPLGTLTQ